MVRSSTHYKIIEKLGEGGQGAVYRGWRTLAGSNFKQVVAIKILNSKISPETWRAEFDSLAAVRSPYCLQALAFEYIDGQPALILEFVDGITLAEWAQQADRTEAGIQEILAQIECGLIDLHQDGLFHGDLSPKNVMIDRTGTVRLLDYGYANFSEITRLTPEFCAPERLTGEMPTLKSDLYSLGLIEEWLLGRSIPNSNYLEPRPEFRRIRGRDSDPEAKSSMSQTCIRVLLARGSRRSTLQFASGLLPSTHSVLSMRGWLARAVCVVLLLLSVVQADSTPGWNPNTNLVRIRTMGWRYITLNGKALGYAPLDIWVDTDEDQIIGWRGPDSSGQLKIRLKDHETRVLRDSDLMH